MTTKYWMMGGGGVLGLVAAVAMIVPASRHIVVGTVRGEADQDGKYVSEWVDDLSNSEDTTRTEATQALGSLGKEARKALPALTKQMTDDPVPRVRSSAAFAVFKITSAIKQSGGHATEARDGLTHALQDPDPIVRMNAAMALGFLEADARDSVPALIEAISERAKNNRKVLTFNMTVREQMIVDLGAIGPDAREAVALLRKLLVDDEEMTRTVAARALGRIGPDAKAAVPELLAAIDDIAEAVPVQDSAREAIRQIDPETASKLEEK